MKCTVCDRCREIIKNPRHIRVITCARPLKSPIETCVVGGKPIYRGNDRQQNDIFWEKELCDACVDALEVFFEAGETTEPGNPDVPDNPAAPDAPDDSGVEVPPAQVSGASSEVGEAS